MKYEPYNFDSFKELVQRGYGMGWYDGHKCLFNLKMDGAFEGFSGRATETWEQQFILTSDLFEGEIKGKGVKEVCDRALEQLNKKN